MEIVTEMIVASRSQNRELEDFLRDAIGSDNVSDRDVAAILRYTDHVTTTRAS